MLSWGLILITLYNEEPSEEKLLCKASKDKLGSDRAMSTTLALTDLLACSPLLIWYVYTKYTHYMCTQAGFNSDL